MSKKILSKDNVDNLRDLVGKLNRASCDNPQEQYFMSPPVKDKLTEVIGPSVTITGVVGQKTNLIPGDKAGSDRVSGSFEGGSKNTGT